MIGMSGSQDPPPAVYNGRTPCPHSHTGSVRPNYYYNSTTRGNLTQTTSSMNCSLEEAKEIFDMVDKDKSQTISTNELVKALEGCSNISKDDAAEMIKALDSNKDGVVSWGEFKVLFEARKK